MGGGRVAAATGAARVRVAVVVVEPAAVSAVTCVACRATVEWRVAGCLYVGAEGAVEPMEGVVRRPGWRDSVCGVARDVWGVVDGDPARAV